MTRFDATDRRPVDKWTAAPRPTTSPQGQKPQQKRSTHMVHKPVNSECSRQSDGFCHQDHARQHEIESEWDMVAFYIGFIPLTQVVKSIQSIGSGVL